MPFICQAIHARRFARGCIYICACICVVMACATMTACGSKSSAESAKPANKKAPESVPVLAADVQSRDIPIELSAVGTVESINTVTIKPQVDGRLEAVHIKDGDDVQKGQLLFTIDSRPFTAVLNQVAANHASDTVKANQAATDNARYSSLIKTGAVTHEEADTRRVAAESLRSQVRADQAAIEIARLKQEYCKIVSPIAGRAGAVLVDAGNTVKENDTEMVVINQIAPIDVTFNVAESQLPGLRRAQARGGPLHVTAVPAAKGESPSTGTLSFVDNKVDPQTGTIKLRATFPNEDNRLWPGEFVQVRLVLATERGVLLVPSPAVQTGQQGSFIYVIKPDMTVDYRLVTTERYGEALNIIRKGVQAGERVVSDGQLRLTPGARVEIKTSLDADTAATTKKQAKPEFSGAAR